MADQIYNARLESLLRAALTSEAASLPLTVTPARIIERAERGRRTTARRSLRDFLLGHRDIDLRQLAVAVGAMAIVAVTAALAVTVLVTRPSLIGPPPATPTPMAESSPESSPAPTTATPTATAMPSADASVGRPTSGAMWPQSTLAEAQTAQERADALDAAYSWQIDPMIAEDISHSFDPQNSPFVSRFLREALGWEEFVFNPHVAWDQLYANLVFVRCASGGTNSLYPEDAHAGRCAPTIDDQRYETVRLSLGQPVREGPDGIWVVTSWQTTTPFAQSDPRVVEANATTRLAEFLEARIAGEGAEGYVEVLGYGSPREVQLLYATTAGAAYERYEIERVSGPEWPYGRMSFEARLYTVDGSTVVAQQFTWDSGLSHSSRETTENGQPVAVPQTFWNGAVTVSAALPWAVLFEDEGLGLNGSFGDERLEIVAHPVPIASGCAQGLSPANAAELAESIQSDPDLVATAPVDANIGGAVGLQMDVTAASGASACGTESVLVIDSNAGGRRGVALGNGSRMRLYLLDVPAGSGTQTWAIAIVAPEARFHDVVEAADPVIESIVFRPS